MSRRSLSDMVAGALAALIALWIGGARDVLPLIVANTVALWVLFALDVRDMRRKWADWDAEADQ